MSPNKQVAVIGGALSTLFALVVYSKYCIEPPSKNAGNPNVLSTEFDGNSRFVRFDDDRRAGYSDQIIFYNKQGVKWEPVCAVTDVEIDTAKAKKAAEQFIASGDFGWDDEIDALMLYGVPPALPSKIKYC
jgi:hypothetical protein